MRHTKIIATVGPASDSDRMIDDLIAAGTDIVRLNFSHGTQQWHGETCTRVRQAAQRAGRYFGVADSGHIVIDEVAGYLVTMSFLPRTAFAAITGFVLFRICDVFKPWPARHFDRDPRWKNGAGVVLDDLFAGVWALVLTWGALLVKQRFFGP